ncbi:hypothetical protein FSP39_012737 [Pinctada imbricata]|uniref:Myelin regulatory factor n=1 Tax=Pinctada imbricata TaxID=66713 RepID=A0AA88YC98_PINIB|nr:hypothetical protein FSP39_012737 [Pinctada imbricata]
MRERDDQQKLTELGYMCLRGLLVHPAVTLTKCTLPDSPPDSEPYSPPDGHRNGQTVNGQSSHGLSNHSNNAISQESKYGIVNPATTMHQHMYPPHHRPPGLLPHAHKMPPGYNEPLNHLPPTHPAPQSSTPLPLPPTQANPSIPLSPPHLSPVNGCNKKRKFSDSPNSSLTNALLAGRNGVLNIKQEPNGKSRNGVLNIKQVEPNGSGFMNSYIGDCDDDFGYDPDNSSTGYLDSSYQVIKWSQYLQKEWATLKNEQLKDIPPPSYRVDADKGFNFSQPDDSFVCQKKNHFQVTVHTLVNGDPKYVTTPDGVKKIDSFHLHFFGIKMESQTQTIKIEQSQSDRSKKPFYPVRVDLVPDQTNKITVGRLHFSETTANNMRKKGRPNPDQRYFMLVVGLYAHSGENKFLVAGSVSEKIIVRAINKFQASNPGQFDNDVDVNWQKGQTGDSVFHVGRVGINTDHPEEALTVHGNMSLTGRMYQPSDIRAKENLKEVNSKKQLENLAKLKIYEYNYSEDFADTVGIPENGRKDTGVIAQEVKDILPDAVRETGDVPLPNGDVIENLLVVDKERVFMENVGAVKELCKLTDNLEVRIDELEKMNKKLAKLKRYDSLKSTVSSKSSCSVSTVSSSPPKKSSSSSSPSAAKYNHNRHKPSSRKPSDMKPAVDNGWCSNRFIQVTIFTLILIMALWAGHHGKSTPSPRPTSRMPSVNMSATTISPQIGPSITESAGSNTLPDEQIKATHTTTPSTIAVNWKIPIGKFFSSRFIFRVAQKTLTDVCSLEKTTSDVQYAEYRLDFHRTCDGGEL